MLCFKLIALFYCLCYHTLAYKLHRDTRLRRYLHGNADIHVSSVPMTLDSTVTDKLDEKLIGQEGLWFSAQSLNPDADAAVDEVLRDLSSTATRNEALASNQGYAMIFFVSSIYESASFRYENIFEKAKLILPQVSDIIGCTTGCSIGQTASGSPIEAESRPSFSALIIPFNDNDGIQIKSFSISSESYSEDQVSSAVGDDSISLVFASQDAKILLSKIMLGKKKGRIIGSLASCVTALQNPKVFRWQAADNKIDKMSRGVVGINIRGNIELNIGIAQSCKPVGPIFKLSDVSGSNIRAMEVSWNYLVSLFKE